MIKKLCTAILMCILGAAPVFAQEIMLDSVSEKSFGGVRIDQHGQFIYTQHLVENPRGNDSNLVVIGMYDLGLMPLKRIEYAIGPMASVASLSFNGQFFIIILADPANKTRTTVLMDREGGVMKKKDETNLRLAILQPDNYPLIFSSLTNDFTVLYPIGEKNAGYELIVYDQELEPRIKKSFVPTEGAWTIQDMVMDMEKLNILRKEINAAGDKTSYSLHQVNTMTGETQNIIELKRDDNLITPRSIRLRTGEIITGGTFTKRANSSASEGMFITRIDAAGKQFSHIIPWEILKQAVKSDISSDLANGKMNVFVEDYILRPNNEGYTIIGQAYSKTDDNGVVHVKTGDILLFHLTPEGAPARIDKIDLKPREAIVKGNLAGESDHTINNWLAKRGFFSYSGSSNLGGQPSIAYNAIADDQIKAYFSSIDSPKNDQIQGIDINRVAALTGEKSSQPPSPITYTYSTARYTPETSSGVILGLDERTIFFDFRKPKLVIWTQPINPSPR
jgi:hypothetical protein